MLLTLLAALACLMSAVSTLAMWDAVRTGHVASAAAMASLGATGISGLLCILLARQQRWFGIVLMALVAAGGGLLTSYLFVEPIRRWSDAAMGWTN